MDTLAICSGDSFINREKADVFFTASAQLGAPTSAPVSVSPAEAPERQSRISLIASELVTHFVSIELPIVTTYGTKCVNVFTLKR